MCREIYQLLLAPSENRLSSLMETEEGCLPPAEEDFYNRFGGLN